MRASQSVFALVVVIGCAQTPAPVESVPRVSMMVDTTDIPHVRIARHETGSVARFPKFAQCQIAFALKHGRADDLSEAASPADQSRKVMNCVEMAASDSVSVLVLPELSLAMPEPDRAALLTAVSKRAAETKMVIIAGSYYDENSYNRLAVVGPGWIERGYKTRPSRFEVSPRAGKGMRPANEVLVVTTDYGRIAVITCVDLISDGVQFALRNLANQGAIDAIVNINYNPSSWEFLIEANSIARRHAVFVSVTNVSQPAAGRCLSNGKPDDNGYCFGNSAIFASLRNTPEDAPNNSQAIVGDLPAQFLEGSGPTLRRSLAYDNLVGDPGAFVEGLLSYDLNMRLIREPLTTNAPDQGYPPIRNLRFSRLRP